MASWIAKKLSSKGSPGSRESGRIPAYSANPDIAWDKEKVRQKVKVLKPQDWNTPKPENHTRFVCISDTHGRTDRLVELPPGDVLLHGGDFSNIGLPKDIEKFANFLTSQTHTHKVVIAGNHDLTFDTEKYPQLWRTFCHKEMFDCEQVKDLVRKAPGVTYLEDSGTTINGISIWPEFCGWAFNLERGLPCQEKWDLIPEEGVDILITHGPPLGHGDLCSNGARAGCLQLLHAVQRIQPKYHVFGHIHEAYGITTDEKTIFVNASSCNLNYKPVNPPIVFDLPNKAE